MATSQRLHRVCHLTSVHSHTDIRIFIKECRTLAAAGFETHLVAPGAPEGVYQGVVLHGIPNSTGRRLVRLTHSIQAVYRQALAIDAAVYHFHDPELIPVGLLLKRRGKRVIYDIHEDLPRQILQKSYLPQRSRRLIGCVVEQLENRAAQYFSALITATPTIGARFAPINPRTVVLNNYPLRSELLLAEPVSWAERAMSVAYVGGMTAERGMFEMVEAMTLVSPKLEAKLELAGEIWPAQQRKKLMQGPGWSRVRELGVVGRAEVARLLGRVRAGLVLLHPYPNIMHSQPIKLFEYMSAGIPVIGSDFPLWRGFLEPTGCGLLVNPLDTHAIARAIELMLTQPEAAAEMGRRGRVAVEQQYNWENETHKLLGLYSTL